VITRVVKVDLAIAVVLAALVLIISPGVAIAGMLALLVLAVCAVSFVVTQRRRRR
jgi:hypothetical protein